MLIINFLKKYRILLTIILIASILRLWNLDNFPPHLRNDEASLGYNAYSILKTGRDEHGNFLPLIFEAFGDWKMGLYVYLVVPFVAVLGLTETAVRLPYALAGIVSVLFLYGVALEWFNRKTALAAAFLLSISPLFVAFSRGAWDVTFGLTLAAIYFFLRALRGKNIYFLLSSLCFGISLLASQEAKFSTPLILLLLIIISFKELKRVSGQTILAGFFIIFLFSCPVLLSFIQGKVTRLATLSIFSYPPSANEWPVVYYTKAILSRWLSLYSFKSLFFKGDLNPQHGAPDMGPFLLMDALFLFLGIVKVVRTELTKQILFILTLLALLALPSALTIEKANFERVMTLFFPLLLIEALGVTFFWEKGRGKRWLLFVVIALYVTNYVYFFDQYFIHNPKKNDAWQYGYKQIVEKVMPLQTKYPEIVVQQSLEQPYIFFLFYQKYDPQKYQQTVGQVFTPNKEGKDMGLVSSIGNIKFANIDWKDKAESKTLYVMPKYLLDRESQFYSSYKEIDTVYDLNGFPLFKLVELNERYDK